MIASGIGLANVHAINGQETSSFVDQAIAQDLVNLVVAGPATVLLAWLARRGSVRADLLWIGVLTFTVYNYVSYTMAIHVGSLFLAWVAVLSLTFLSLVGGLRAVRPPAVAATLAGAPRRLVGWYLIVIAAVFTMLRLSDIVPAVLAGRPPTAPRIWRCPPTRCTCWTWRSSCPRSSPSAAWCCCAALPA